MVILLNMYLVYKFTTGLANLKTTGNQKKTIWIIDKMILRRLWAITMENSIKHRIRMVYKMVYDRQRSFILEYYETMSNFTDMVRVSYSRKIDGAIRQSNPCKRYRHLLILSSSSAVFDLFIYLWLWLIMTYDYSYWTLFKCLIQNKLLLQQYRV